MCVCVYVCVCVCVCVWVCLTQSCFLSLVQIEDKTGVSPASQRAYYCGDEIRGPLAKLGFSPTDILQVFLFQRVTKAL